MTDARPDAGRDQVVMLSGGVGGAKLALGLSRVMKPDRLVIVANTADDFTCLGLHVSPDIDTVVYTLAGLADPERGWGRAEETWNFIGAISELGGEDWFRLGDRDLAMHITRTRRLAEGASLTEVTAQLARALDVGVSILPMTDQSVATVVETARGDLAFQHYFVRERCEPEVTGFRFAGISDARINPVLERVLGSGRVAGVIIGPSNPYVSIDPILRIPGMRTALESAGCRVLAVSPIVGGKAIKGPAAKMMAELGVPATATGIAHHYGRLADILVIDHADRDETDAIRDLGLEVLCTATVMHTLEDREQLARDCLRALGLALP